MKEGHYLGSGDDLCEQYAISRPTLHQVARALEHEQIVSVRRGPNGGYYVRRPSLSAAVSAVATYLRSNDTDIWHFITLSRVMHADVCRLAASSTDPELRGRLTAELDGFWNRIEEVDALTLTKRDYLLEGILFEMAANPVVELFMRSMHHFGYATLAQNLVNASPDRIKTWISHRRRLCRSLLDGEERIAMAISQSHWDHMVVWLEEFAGPDPEKKSGKNRIF
jgi:DNA-binding FadR family transcriptional regulator